MLTLSAAVGRPARPLVLLSVLALILVSSPSTISLFSSSSSSSSPGFLVRAAPASAVSAEDDRVMDYYEVLGLADSRDDATERDVKSAFRKLSKTYHPDIAGEGHRRTYQRIQRAYEVLGDRKKRKIYDILGHEGVENFEKPQQAQQQNPFGVFAQFFGGGGGPQQQQNRGEDKHFVLRVDLEDFYTGAAHVISFNKTKLCRSCHGSGARSKQDIVPCRHCNGSGRVVRRVQVMPGFVQNMQQPCSHCGGRGKHVAHVCPTCRGRRVARGAATISVDVESGLPEGHVLIYELEGDQQPGVVPGDVRVTVLSAPHPILTRHGDDLHAEVRLTLREALIGFAKTLTHLDGHAVELQREGVTQHREEQRLKGEGMPKHHVPSERGDLIVTYTIEMREKPLTPAQQAWVRENL